MIKLFIDNRNYIDGIYLMLRKSLSAFSYS